MHTVGLRGSARKGALARAAASAPEMSGLDGAGTITEGLDSEAAAEAERREEPRPGFTA